MNNRKIRWHDPSVWVKIGNFLIGEKAIIKVYLRRKFKLIQIKC